jgi:hypothetical protein
MSFIIVLGNSYDVKDSLKSRFNFKFDFEQKIWFRPVLQDKYWFFEQAVEALSKNISCAWVQDINKLDEAKKLVREIESLNTTTVEVPAHRLDGSIFEMSAWYARAFKENNNTAYAFRNLKISKVKRETAKAYQVDAEFFSGIASTCGVCGRELSNDVSRATGIGPICAQKIGLPRPTMESAKETVKLMEQMSKAQGIFTDVWVPKSQIKHTLTDKQEQKAV